jgi:hypothetical protein
MNGSLSGSTRFTVLLTIMENARLRRNSALPAASYKCRFENADKSGRSPLNKGASRRSITIGLLA